MEGIMGIGRIISILCAIGWISLGPALGQDSIKIGVTQPLTGAFAASGNYVAQGARMAEDDVNKSRRRYQQED
jgi:branched-chain amino acid transport system substrate-binding protein